MLRDELRRATQINMKFGNTAFCLGEDIKKVHEDCIFDLGLKRTDKMKEGEDN